MKDIRICINRILCYMGLLLLTILGCTAFFSAKTCTNIIVLMLIIAGLTDIIYLTWYEDRVCD